VIPVEALFPWRRLASAADDEMHFAADRQPTALPQPAAGLTKTSAEGGPLAATGLREVPTTTASPASATDHLARAACSVLI
jgi:hypothetical protein